MAHMNDTQTWHRTKPNFPARTTENEQDIDEALEALIEQGRVEWSVDDEGHLIFRSTQIC